MSKLPNWTWVSDSGKPRTKISRSDVQPKHAVKGQTGRCARSRTSDRPGLVLISGRRPPGLPGYRIFSARSIRLIEPVFG
ncbi:hypothetical protein SprV_0100412200 [Sparganum proliferum]